MTRLELLKILVGQARSNGFEFRRWYTTRLGLPWISADAAFTLLDQQRRYYALLFSHDFAEAFWKPGTEITFQVSSQTFDRVLPDGTVVSVTRKPFTRRTTRNASWKWHLQHMAVAEEPLRYMRKYLSVAEELEDDITAEPLLAETTPNLQPLDPVVPTPRRAPGPKPKKSPKPLPKSTPTFLRRPYP